MAAFPYLALKPVKAKLVATAADWRWSSTRARLLDRNAVAISSACGIPIAVAGTIGYILFGWNIPNRPAWSLGYIYAPAFIGIVAGSVVFAPMGAKLAHSLPTQLLKRMFAIFIFIVGCKLLL